MILSTVEQFSLLVLRLYFGAVEGHFNSAGKDVVQQC